MSLPASDLKDPRSKVFCTAASHDARTTPPRALHFNGCVSNRNVWLRKNRIRCGSIIEGLKIRNRCPADRCVGKDTFFMVS